MVLILMTSLCKISVSSDATLAHFLGKVDSNVLHIVHKKKNRKIENCDEIKTANFLASRPTLLKTVDFQDDPLKI